MLAAAPGVGARLALLRGVPPARRGTRGGVQRWDERGSGQRPVGLAAAGRGQRQQRRDRQAGDGQRVRAAGEGLQQGGLRRVQRGGVPAHPTGTRFGHTHTYGVAIHTQAGL